MGVEQGLERFFEQVGRVVGAHPVKSLLCSGLFVLGAAAGITFLENETRPERQWVARDALALAHDAYVKETWPGNARFNLFTATCNDVEEEQCNILDPKYITRFHEINQQIMSITVDGEAIVADLDASHRRSGPWQRYQGNWSFMGRPESVNGSVSFEGRKCFAFGPFCGKSSLLDVFRDDDYVIRNLQTAQVTRAVNFWEDQETLCPLSIATADSPCFDSNCQKYGTTVEREACRDLARSYCAARCETETRMVGDRQVTVAKDFDTCQDRGCIQLGNLGGGTTTAPPGQLNTDPGEAPESAFEFQPSKVKTLVGGLVKESGVYVAGKHLSGFYAVNKDELFCPRQGTEDPVADEWERQALCLMGIDADSRATPKLECKEDELLKFNGLFGRSLNDEFGAAIRGDIVKLTASYGVIIVYCAVMLGKCDAVHSGVALALVAVLIVGLTVGSTMGLMGYLGVPNSNLNNNLYFLLLGLGVDDAFVLTSEFRRHGHVEDHVERVAMTCRSGGISVLITSATDALAFLVGASTVLPALGWFCTYAGVSIVLCYLFQLTIFLPCLALNARRVASSRADCCCCFRCKERSIEDPQGCCCLCLGSQVSKADLLRRGLKGFALRVTRPFGQLLTLLVFVAMAALGAMGSAQIYKDFKLEWFIPDSSYVNEFFVTNEQEFATGTPITVNLLQQPDAYEAQDKLREVYSYLNSSSLLNQDVAVESWYQEFMEWAAPPQAVTQAMAFQGTGETMAFANRDEFYTALHHWYRGNTGSRFRGSLLWADEECNVNSTHEEVPAGCAVSEGLRASRLNAELSLEQTRTGTLRFATMTALRSKVEEIYPGAFPYSFDFLYWEEVGIIDVELTRNLAICGGVIFLVIFALVPKPRVAIWVVLCVFLSIMDTLGFMYFWDVTISGVSTIYLLICVGLAVDYAAHIAHMFKDAKGTARERAVEAVERIGVCTFNAVISTLLAVVVVGFSESYVFRVFFKVLFLVVAIAGAHGLWLLPVLLSLFGGADDATSRSSRSSLSLGKKVMETE